MDYLQKPELCPVVILCGGQGVRLREKTIIMPKPMLPIGSKPILWHVMKVFASQGFTHFILCLGYKGIVIKKYFSKILKTPSYRKWYVQFAQTGLKTPSAGRVQFVKKLIKSKHFMLTYADGLADIDLRSLLRYHLIHGKIGTVTSVHPFSYFGEMKINNSGLVKQLKEKPKLKSFINGGFFVFKSSFLKKLSPGDMLENNPLVRLIKQQQLMAYKHMGFWKCMDTYKDFYELNLIWKQGDALWKIW